MSEKVYEKYLSAEQLQNMKASTLRKLNKEEERAVGTFILFAAVSFAEVIAIVAALLWMNKFTLFFSIVGALFVMLCGYVLKTTFKSYKKFIKSISEENASIQK